MARFRYALQAALDDARVRERSSLAAFASARARECDEETALGALREQARALRASLAREPFGRGSTYIEAGLRLAALAGAERERRDRLARAGRAAVDARADLARSAARRRAVEIHRARKHGRWLAAQALCEVRELEEANAARTARFILRQHPDNPAVAGAR